MKTLLVLRHGKSSWKYEELSDLARPIKGMGVKELIETAGEFEKLRMKIDLVLCSPAVRAYSTARIFLDQCKQESTEIKFTLNLYNKSATEILKAIQITSNKVNCLLIVGHEPMLNELVCMCNNQTSIELPTGTLFVLTFKTNQWKSIGKIKSVTCNNIVPKRHLFQHGN